MKSLRRSNTNAFQRKNIPFKKNYRDDAEVKRTFLRHLYQLPLTQIVLTPINLHRSIQTKCHCLTGNQQNPAPCVQPAQAPHNVALAQNKKHRIQRSAQRYAVDESQYCSGLHHKSVSLAQNKKHRIQRSAQRYAVDESQYCSGLHHKSESLIDDQGRPAWWLS